MPLNVTDITNRPPVSASIKDAIKTAFLDVPEGKNSALLAIYDIDAEAVRLHFAWKVNNTWKVGSQVGWSLDNNIEGYVGVEAAW